MTKITPYKLPLLTEKKRKEKKKKRRKDQPKQLQIWAYLLGKRKIKNPNKTPTQRKIEVK